MPGLRVKRVLAAQRRLVIQEELGETDALMGRLQLVLQIMIGNREIHRLRLELEKSGRDKRGILGENRRLKEALKTHLLQQLVLKEDELCRTKDRSLEQWAVARELDGAVEEQRAGASTSGLMLMAIRAWFDCTNQAYPVRLHLSVVRRTRAGMSQVVSLGGLDRRLSRARAEPKSLLSAKAFGRGPGHVQATGGELSMEGRVAR